MMMVCVCKDLDAVSLSCANTHELTHLLGRSMIGIVGM